MEIEPGGMLSVDTEALERLGRSVAEDADAVDDASARIGRAVVVTPQMAAVMPVVIAVAWRMSAIVERQRRLAEVIRRTFIAYELAELYAAAHMHSLAGTVCTPSAAEAQRQIDALLAKHPTAHRDALWLLTDWRSKHGEQLPLPGMSAGVWSMFLPLVLANPPGKPFREGTFGRVLPGQRPSGDPGRPDIRRVITAAPSHPPTSLEDSLRRIPRGDDASVRVEKYSFADGTSEYALYVSGTRGDGESVLSWESNAKLYTGESSQAFRAVELALADAGVQPGDRVHAYGHSQGGMVAAYVASAGDVDVPTLVTIGAPVEPLLGDETTVVSIRHDNDPVALLTAGGWAGTTGSDDSVVVSDVRRDEFGEITIPGHGFDLYMKTVEEFEASGHDRVLGATEHLRHLAEAERVEAFEYAPVQVDPGISRR